MSRVIVVSNRVAVARDTATTKARAGGLAVAIESVLRETGGLWFGWSGELAPATSSAPRLTKVDGVTYATIDLSAEDRAEYYNGFANRTLWPLFHYRTDLATYDRKYYEGYLRVNEMFARHLAGLLRPDDIVWVHDFHLVTIGRELRRMGLRQPLGFFLHIPFPAEQIMLAVPHHRELVEALFAYDLVGLQTENNLRALRDYVVYEAEGEARHSGHLAAFGTTTHAAAFPIGIDANEFMAMAESPLALRQFERTRSSLLGCQLALGVDRLDYSKGLHERLRAYERLLEMYRENRNRVTLIQVAPPSRSDVPEYRMIRRDLERLTGHINGRFAELDWVPIRYLNRSFIRRSLAGLYRAARVGLVTPFRDGMNLVAKEYVAAQAEDDPGVLILSQFAGAARELSSALIVNPFDVQAVADAMQQALHMSVDERRERWSAMIPSLKRYDLRWWQRRFLAALDRRAAAA